MLPADREIEQLNHLNNLYRVIERNEFCINTIDLGNNITLKGMRLLCDALTHPNNNITWLSFNNGHLTRDKLSCLRNALESPFNKVTELYLNDNKIDNEGMINICEALEHSNNKVKILYVCNNLLDDNVLIRIKKALTHWNNKLVEFGMDYNRMTTNTDNFFETIRNIKTFLILCSIIGKKDAKSDFKKMPVELVRKIKSFLY